MLGSLWVPRGKKTPFNNRLIRMERTSWFERLLHAEDADGKPRFHRVKAPSHCDLNTLVHTLSHHITRCLEKRGLLEPMQRMPS